MIWRAPWAWIGLITIILPVLIHLFGRGHARRQLFPTLRFLGVPRPLPTSRSRLRDLVLLAVRIGIVAAAVAALAQPLLLTSARRATINRSLARAIIVDTSASMQSSMQPGVRAVDAALREARHLADSAATSVVLRTSAPGEAIEGATAWLGRQPGRTEVDIVSDFQAGAFDPSDLATIPRSVGVRFVAVRGNPRAAPMVVHTEARGHDVTAQVVLSPGGIDVEWVDGPIIQRDGLGPIVLLAGAADALGTDAARTAAGTVGVLTPIDSDRIAVAYPAYPGRTSLIREATPLTPWMADLVVRLAADPDLVDAASHVKLAATPDTAGTLTVVRDEGGSPVVQAVAATINGGDRLLLLPLVDPGSLMSASLLAAANRALSHAPPVAEMDPATIADSTLSAWQRPPSSRSAPGPDSTASDGRWFWAAALLLLGIETILRRGVSSSPGIEVAHDTVG